MLKGGEAKSNIVFRLELEPAPFNEQNHTWGMISWNCLKSSLSWCCCTVHKLLTPLPRAATQASLLPGPAQTSLPGAAAPPFPLTVAAASSQPISLLASLPGPVMMSSWIDWKNVIRKNLSCFIGKIPSTFFMCTKWSSAEKVKKWSSSLKVSNLSMWRRREATE